MMGEARPSRPGSGHPVAGRPMGRSGSEGIPTIDGHGVAVLSMDQSFSIKNGTVNSLTGLTPGETIVVNARGGGVLDRGVADHRGRTATCLIP